MEGTGLVGWLVSKLVVAWMDGRIGIGMCVNYGTIRFDGDLHTLPIPAAATTLPYPPIHIHTHT